MGFKEEGATIHPGFPLRFRRLDQSPFTTHCLCLQTPPSAILVPAITKSKPPPFLKEIQLEDPLENVGVKLVRQAGAKTNDLAGDGSTTSIILAHGLISEGVKVIAAGMNPIQISRGIQRTAEALVSELKLMSREVMDYELSDVATISAGNDFEVGSMISEAFQRVGRKGIITIEKGNFAENNL